MDPYIASITPVAPPPPGVVPNFIDPPSQQAVIVVYTTVFTVIATLGVAARMYARIFVMRKVALEDYLLTLSWAFFMAFNGLVYAAATRSVMGRHAWDVNLLQLEYFTRLLNVATIIYGPIFIFAKGALILLWQRIFAETANRRALWWFLRVLLYINIAIYICGMSIQTFLCTPREKIWKPWTEGKCLNTGASFLYTAAWNLFLDVVLLVIPLSSTRHLKLQKKRKWILMGCFALGIVTVIASALRIVYAVELASSTDAAFDAQNSIWSGALENTGVILVICAPAVQKLWRHFRGKATENPAPQYPSRQRGTDVSRSTSGLCKNKSWIELGDKSPEEASFANKDDYWDSEKEPTYHDLKRSESMTRPMKVHVRNEVSVSSAPRRTRRETREILPRWNETTGSNISPRPSQEREVLVTIMDARDGLMKK